MAAGRTHIVDIVSSLSDQNEKERFTKALNALGPHVVYKREVSNGKDFLFEGTSGSLHDALKDLASLEHCVSNAMQFNYARLDNFLLFRITGKAEMQPLIDAFFEPDLPR